MLHYLLPFSISNCPAPGATAASGENSDKGEFSHLCGTSWRLPGNGSGHQCDAGQHTAGEHTGDGQEWLGQEPAPPAQLLQPCSAAHMHSQGKAEPIDIEKLQGLSRNDLLPIKAEVN